MSVRVSEVIEVALGEDLEALAYDDRYNSSVRSEQRPIEDLASSNGCLEVNGSYSSLDKLSIFNRKSLE